MAYMWRYNPAINEIVRLVQNGTLGDIFYYRGHIPKPKSWHQTMESENGCYKVLSILKWPVIWST